MSDTVDLNPAVLIPYPGISSNPEEQDIFVCLRPESNGVLVESIMLKVIQHNPEFKKRLVLVYLANLPGEFILRNRVTEDHYPVKIKFADLGSKIFTRAMKEAFSKRFKVDFARARILGAFEALDALSMSCEELFNTWVPDEDIMIINGQTIKKIRGAYVVNCDIPALLRIKYKGANIAVMIFRTSMNYAGFTQVVRLMEKALLDARVLLPERPTEHIFHYSKGPFEQVSDGMGYLYTPDAVHIPLADLPFSRFLASRGLDFSILRGLLLHPVVQYERADGTLREENIYVYTRGASYEEAWEKVGAIKSQALLVPDSR
ncbi:MAG: hypothetical protein LBQ57_07965 [Spirochaetales bacterium]|jgi:hypothetical protein|nr:hypothetical protein [Spirochaetales bacterium]